MLIAGIGARYNCETSKAIPSQWQRFGPYIGHISGQVGDVCYGVCCNSDDENNFDYIAGVEVTDFSDLPEEFSRVRIPARKYRDLSASGSYLDHPQYSDDCLGQVPAGIGHEVADAPNFERYGPEFDPRTGNGGSNVRFPSRLDHRRQERPSFAAPPSLFHHDISLPSANPL